MRIETMNTFTQAGEAMLQSHEGSRLIAEALWAAIKSGARRVARFVAASFNWAPGPHMLP